MAAHTLRARVANSDYSPPPPDAHVLRTYRDWYGRLVVADGSPVRWAPAVVVNLDDDTVLCTQAVARLMDVSVRFCDHLYIRCRRLWVLWMNDTEHQHEGLFLHWNIRFAEPDSVVHFCCPTPDLCAQKHPSSNRHVRVQWVRAQVRRARHSSRCVRASGALTGSLVYEAGNGQLLTPGVCITPDQDCLSAHEFAAVVRLFAGGAPRTTVLIKFDAVADTAMALRRAIVAVAPGAVVRVVQVFHQDVPKPVSTLAIDGVLLQSGCKDVRRLRGWVRGVQDDVPWSCTTPMASMRVTSAADVAHTLNKLCAGRVQLVVDARADRDEIVSWLTRATDQVLQRVPLTVRFVVESYACVRWLRTVCPALHARGVAWSLCRPLGEEWSWEVPAPRHNGEIELVTVQNALLRMNIDAPEDVLLAEQRRGVPWDELLRCLRYVHYLEFSLDEWCAFSACARGCPELRAAVRRLLPPDHPTLQQLQSSLWFERDDAVPTVSLQSIADAMLTCRTMDRAWTLKLMAAAKPGLSVVSWWQPQILATEAGVDSAARVAACTDTMCECSALGMDDAVDVDPVILARGVFAAPLDAALRAAACRRPSPGIAFLQPPPTRAQPADAATLRTYSNGLRRSTRGLKRKGCV